jgi:cation-transporting P-type ATPase 13A2
LVFYYIGCLLTGGILWLLCGVYSRLWQVQITCKICSLADAQFVIIRDPYDQKFVSVIVVKEWTHESVRPEYIYTPKYEYDDRQPLNGTTAAKRYYRYFDHQNMRYAWRPDLGEFERLCGLECGNRCCDLVERYRGLRQEERDALVALFGENFINIEVKPYINLFFEEVINPFYIFQILSMILWIIEQYYIYSGCLFAMSVMSIWMSMYEIRQVSSNFCIVCRCLDISQ